MLGTGQREVTHYMKAMPSSYGPSWHHGNDHLRHEADLTLYLENIQAVVAVFTYVSLVSPGPLVSTRTKGPFAIFG